MDNDWFNLNVHQQEQNQIFFKLYVVNEEEFLWLNNIDIILKR